MIFRFLGGDFRHLGQSMRRFQRRNDPFKLAAELKGFDGFIVGGGKKLNASHIIEPGVLRPDAGIVETGRDRVCLLDLSIVVHQQISSVAVQHTRAPAGNRGSVLPALESVAGCFNAIDFNRAFIEERVKEPHGI